MSAIQSQVSDDAIGSRGLVSGEATPSDRASTMAKLAYSDEDLRAAIEAAWDDFLAHDHASLGGAKLGKVLDVESGQRADSFEPDTFTEDKLNSSSVKDDAIDTHAVNETHVPDGSVTQAKIGGGVPYARTISPSSSIVINHGLGRTPHYALAGNDSSNPWRVDDLAVTDVDDNTITVSCGSAATVVVNFKLVVK